MLADVGAKSVKLLLQVPRQKSPCSLPGRPETGAFEFPDLTGGKLAGTRSGSSAAIEAIQEIAAAVKRLREASQSLAGEAGERTSTTAQMAQQAAGGAEAIAHKAGGVAGAASTTTTGTRETDRHASQLGTLAAQMQELAAAFQV